MGANTKIEWCDFTFNPWRGCQKVAAGCTNCYAEAQSNRNPGVLGIWGQDGTRVIASEDMWKQPLKWDRKASEAGERHRVFCASLADVFEDWGGQIHDSHGNLVWFNETIGVMETDDGKTGFAFRRRWATLADVRARLFKLIDATPNLDWQLLTKRPENIRKMWVDPIPVGNLDHRNSAPYGSRIRSYRENVWIGTSIAEQADAERNVPLLLKCRDLAPVLFLSVEPLIGPVGFRGLKCGHEFDCEGATFYDALRGASYWNDGEHGCFGPSIDQVIIGGESGPHARPCNVEWIRWITRQCREAKCPVFVKQLGSRPIEGGDFSKKTGPMETVSLSDFKGGDPDEWQEDLRVREFPSLKQE